MSRVTTYTCDGCGAIFEPVFKETLTSSYIASDDAIDACVTCTRRMREALHAPLGTSAVVADLVNERQAKEIATLKSEVQTFRECNVSLLAESGRLEEENTRLYKENNDLAVAEASALNESTRLKEFLREMVAIARKTVKHSMNDERAIARAVDVVGEPIAARKIGAENRLADVRDTTPRRQADVTSKITAYTTCGLGGCIWPHGHAGGHAGRCGCTNGCKASDCPN